MKEQTFFRKTRLRLHLTQAEICDMMSISRTAYMKLENGLTHIINDSALRFCEVTGTPLYEMVLQCYPETPGNVLQESADQQEALSALREEYEARLKRKDDESRGLRELIEALQHTITVQEQIIGMLQRQSDKNE